MAKSRKSKIKELIESFEGNKSDSQVIDSPSSKSSRAAAYKDIAEQMFIGLVIQGIKEFAPYLVESFAKGYGVKPNLFLSDLTGLIGGKLSDISTVGSPPIEEIAKACVEQIKLNAGRYAGQEIPVDVAMQVVAHFDQQVKTMSASVAGLGKHSYAESIATDVMSQVVRMQESAASSASSSGSAAVRELFGERKDDSPDLSEQQQKEAALKAEAEHQAALKAEAEHQAALKAEAERQAEEQRLKLLEEQHQREIEAAKAEADREAEEQRLKLLEEQREESSIEHSQDDSHVQLTGSPNHNSGPGYGSFPGDSSNHVAIDVHPSAGVNTPLLPAHHANSVSLTGDTANDSADTSCCPCCSIM